MGASFGLTRDGFSILRTLNPGEEAEGGVGGAANKRAKSRGARAEDMRRAKRGSDMCHERRKEGEERNHGAKAVRGLCVSLLFEEKKCGMR